MRDFQDKPPVSINNGHTGPTNSRVTIVGDTPRGFRFDIAAIDQAIKLQLHVVINYQVVIRSLERTAPIERHFDVKRRLLTVTFHEGPISKETSPENPYALPYQVNKLLNEAIYQALIDLSDVEFPHTINNAVTTLAAATASGCTAALVGGKIFLPIFDTLFRSPLAELTLTTLTTGLLFYPALDVLTNTMSAIRYTTNSNLLNHLMFRLGNWMRFKATNQELVIPD